MSQPLVQSADPFVELRDAEFGRLDAAGETYLDYTGSGLYPASLIREHARFLATAVLGNPHSESPSSSRSTELLDTARQRVLQHFRASPDTYDVVFAANASTAMKLVGEGFPFRPGSALLLTADNHNSVNGIREFARRGGASVTYWELDEELRLTARAVPHAAHPSLFAYPAQSNFSGVHHPLALIPEAQSRGWRVLLDAAAFVPTNSLDLSVHTPDFVAVSFYKMIGFPTGVGALVARREALAELERPWFAGGTVRYASVQNQVHRLLPAADGFHDGTPNFLALPAVTAGLEFMHRVGVERIHEHVGALLATLLETLLDLTHPNGRPLVTVYGPTSPVGRGATVAINVLDSEGAPIPFERVEARAAERRISVRGGCFCNPGASEAAFGLDPTATRRCLEQLGDDFTPLRLAACVGKPVGAIRVSLGMATNNRDIEQLASFLSAFAE